MEPFWYNDFTVLYDPELITQFYPSKEMNIVEQLNACVRCAFYFSILLFIYKGSTSVFYIPIIALGVTYYIWNRIPADKLKFNERFNGSVAINRLSPTYNNPFMNPNLVVHDPNTFLDKSKKVVKFDVNHHIDDIKDTAIKGEVENKFNARLYQGVSDVFNNENSQRQFYHVPSRTYPNDQGTFAKWCWGLDKTCKAGDWPACLNYDDELRGHADVSAIKEPGPSSVTLRKDWF
jgi:hypothetical protein